MQLDDRGRIAMTTEVGRVSYPSLVEPRAMDANQPKKFEMTLINTPVECGNLWQAIVMVARAKWGEAADQMLQSGALSSPLKNGASKPENAEYQGMFFYRMSGKDQPVVFDINGTTQVNPSKVYPGCYARALIKVCPFEQKNERGAIIKKGVTLALDAVQFARDGERLDSRMSAAAAASAFAAAGALPVQAPAPMGGTPAAPAPAAMPTQGFAVPAAAAAAPVAAPAGYAPVAAPAGYAPAPGYAPAAMPAAMPAPAGAYPPGFQPG